MEHDNKFPFDQLDEWLGMIRDHFHFRPFSSREFAQRFNLDNKTAKIWLAQLAEQQHLLKTGSRQGNQYLLPISHFHKAA